MVRWKTLLLPAWLLLLLAVIVVTKPSTVLAEGPEECVEFVVGDDEVDAAEADEVSGGNPQREPGSDRLCAPQPENETPPVESTPSYSVSLPVILLPEGVTSQVVSALSYYVNCTAGNDNNSGTSPTQAWRTLDRANKATLNPGDTLLLKRGCTWKGPLTAKWKGTATSRILISAYGSGTLPKIQNAHSSNVKITGSYQTIEYIQTRSDPEWIDPDCQNQTVGWKAGFGLTDGASYNIVRFSKPTEQSMGMYISASSHHNKILNNTIVGNNMQLRLDKDPATDDPGGFGVLINGNDNVIAHNYFSGNNTWCKYRADGTHSRGDSAAVEIYKGKRNIIRHNRAIQQRTFSELGSNKNVANGIAEDNTYAYNLQASNTVPAIFLILRGDNSNFGPNLRTRVFNNTVHLNGIPESPYKVQGVICHAGCTTDILTLKNNILWAEEKAIFGDACFNESNNIYWSTDGTPLVQLKNCSSLPSASSVKANPVFVSKANNNFHIQSTSPAREKGVTGSGFSRDLDQVLVPKENRVEIGSYEYVP